MNRKLLPEASGMAEQSVLVALWTESWESLLAARCVQETMCCSRGQGHRRDNRHGRMCFPLERGKTTAESKTWEFMGLKTKVWNQMG